MKIFASPLQGYTEAPWRHYHAEIYGGIDTYFTPFIRKEHEEIRRKDLRDAFSPLNSNIQLIPQIIFRDIDEFRLLADTLVENGATQIDLNLGCPFPLQTAKGRGAATLTNTELLNLIASDTATRYASVSFSAKMRLGIDSPDTWRDAMTAINGMHLHHLTVHPRTASEQYSGTLHMDMLAEIISASTAPVVYNGGIDSLASIRDIEAAYPGLYGVMIGRALLSTPSLAVEYVSGQEWDECRRLHTMLRFHAMIAEHYEATLCGETQMLAKIRPIWEYCEPIIGRKAWKAIRKATSMRKYHDAVSMIE